MRRAAKVDTTHGEIRDALRKAGASVYGATAIGGGFPDLVVGHRGFTCLVECKSEQRKLRDSQTDFAKSWQGVIIVARSGEEAVRKFFQEYAISVLKKI